MADHDLIDHAAKSLDYLAEVDQLEKRLVREYAGQNRPKIVADIHGRIGRCLKLAELHVEHAKRVELRQIATGLQMMGLRV